MVLGGLALTAQPSRKTRRKGNEEEGGKGWTIGGKIGRDYPKEPRASSYPSFLPPWGSLLPPAGLTLCTFGGCSWSSPGHLTSLGCKRPSPRSCVCHCLHPNLTRL